MVATAGASLSWLLCEWIAKGKPSLLGICSGAVAGLVAVTPASGYAGPVGAMVDPKMLELSVYDGIPHLLTPVVTDPKKAVVALKWAVREMEERYKNMAKLGVRNIDGYNQRLVEARGKGEDLTRTVHTGFDKETGKAVYEEEKLELEPLQIGRAHV